MIIARLYVRLSIVDNSQYRDVAQRLIDFSPPSLERQPKAGILGIQANSEVVSKSRIAGKKVICLV